ncbi:MAG TPA: DUF4231 domain-containing protein [Candidatus Limnocylindrales bacterium]|nr:DUF4231 domain-containing protein [Candidatus Limnocylindrales bacterium]
MPDPVKEAWQQQRSWSRTADRLKAKIVKYRFASLLLVLCGAALAATATQLAMNVASESYSRIAAVGAACAVGLVPALRVAFDKRTVSDWTRLRAISEALKSEVFTYLAGVGPYRGPDRQAVLTQHVRKVLHEGEDLTLYLPASLPAPTPLPEVSDVASYVQVRLIGQIDGYYRPRVREINHRLAVTRHIQAGLATTGAALGVLALVPNVHTVAWVGVVTTAGTAVAAYAAESRYVYQFIEYSRTVQQLDSMLDGYLQATDSRTWQSDDELVTRCERIISIQNEAWMVKWRNE